MHIRYFLEYCCLRATLSLLDHLPVRFGVFMAVKLANLWYFLNASRRHIAQLNIRRSGLTHDPAEIDRIARASFQNFAILVVESLKSDTEMKENNWREFTTTRIHPETRALIENTTQGIILVSGHIGNWEIAAQLLSFMKPVVGITKKMSNPYSDSLIKKRKPRNRFRLTPMRDANAGRFLSVLKNGEILALLIDQHAKGSRTMVDFFGIPASTHPSPALLHLVTKTPLCFGYCIRTGLMRYELIAGPPIQHARTGNREKDVQCVLEKLNTELEVAIRQYPEQYVWAHRRWRDKESNA